MGHDRYECIIALFFPAAQGGKKPHDTASLRTFQPSDLIDCKRRSPGSASAASTSAVTLLALPLVLLALFPSFIPLLFAILSSSLSLVAHFIVIKVVLLAAELGTVRASVQPRSYTYIIHTYIHTYILHPHLHTYIHPTHAHITPAHFGLRQPHSSPKLHLFVFTSWD